MQREPDFYDEERRPVYEAFIPDTEIPIYLVVEWYTPGRPDTRPSFDNRTGDLVYPGEPPEYEELEFSVIDTDGRDISQSIDFVEIMDLEDTLLSWIRGSKLPLH